MSTISKILVSSSDFVLDNFKNKSVIARLKLNQVVDAKVAKVMSGGKAELVVKGQAVVAKTHVALSENEVVKLKVVGDGETKVLKLVNKNTASFVPEGLNEMRALGRSGLYSKLTQVLSEYLPASAKQQAVKPGQDLPGVLKNDQTEVPQQKTKQNITSLSKNEAAGFEKIESGDLLNLKSLIKNRSMPWATKAATLIVSDEAKNSGLPPKVLEQMAEKLVPAFDKPDSSDKQKPFFQKLVKLTQNFGESLNHKESNLLNNVVKPNSLPVEYKLLSLLSSEKNVFNPEESAVLKKILIESPGLKELKIPELFIQENTGQIQKSINALPGKAVAEKIETILDILALKSEKIPDGESIKAIIKNSGLMWESKLRSVVSAVGEPIAGFDPENLMSNDLKALAMKLADDLEAGGQNTGKILKSFVDGLEKMQLLNSHSADESGRYLLPLPFFSEDVLKFGQLLIDLDQKGQGAEKNSDKALRVAFILEMSSLGHLKADFSIFKKSISGEFGVENDEVKDFLNTLIPGLKQKLEQKAYIVKKIGCSVIPSGELAGTSLTEMLVDNPEGMINIVV